MRYKEYEVLFCERTNKYAIELKELLNDLKNNSNYSPNDLRECVRLAHTINGSAGLMGCGSLNNLASTMEKILREKTNLNQDTINKMISSVDLIIKYSDDFSSLKNSDFQQFLNS
jgi:chemotaxis protein histidine kinase CheA